MGAGVCTPSWLTRALWCTGANFTHFASRKTDLVAGWQMGCGGQPLARNCYILARADEGPDCVTEAGREGRADVSRI